MEKDKLWSEILESLKVSVSSAIFSTWFSRTSLVELKDSGGRLLAEIGCSSPFIKTTLETRYFGLIQNSLSKAIDKPCDLVFSVKQTPVSSEDKKITSPLFENVERNNQIYYESLQSSKIRPLLTFENFAVSSSNQMAWAAAEAVSKNPGSAYNPLFIWGGVGVGKTHLMNAIGFYVLKQDSNNNVLFCSGEEFTNDIVEGIRNKTTQAFRNKYRKLKVLMIDDVQFIAGKDAVQEEFFHTFNALVASGSQILLTSDRPPNEISKLEERLRSRFEAGLIVDIAPPDFELRCAIVQIKTKEKGLNLDMNLVQLIAGNIDSARKVEGFLVKLISEVRLKKLEITTELIESLLGKGEERDIKVIRANPEDVIGAVSKYFSLGKRALLGESRARPVALPRQILMYILRTQLGLPLEEVGRIVGGRDHSTVMHAVGKITHLSSNDVNIREYLMGIKNLF